ncbi:response regulator transcription factor [uncultured Bacteroides sp.]|uniref:response regulator transcription factor n=1 Tax=uncultured Bacteroides sp. TaxID=162156 RepID=UPI002AAA6909|nr:response regulator transcription factor [uncultured Bacteroides sp.]
MKLLIIEDERELSHGIATYLTAEKYLCEQAFTFDEAIEKVSLYSYDCILLDLMLPGGSGLDVLKEIKRQNNPAGVIIISAKDSLDDKVRGLKIGADDYLPKPFHLPELSVRIYALIRRRQFSSNNTLTINNLTIDLLNKEVKANGQIINLTKTEYGLLLFLIGNKNRVVSKSALAEHLSGDMADMLDSQSFVYAHIKNLKAKLAETGCPDYIKNIYGTGYKWIE